MEEIINNPFKSRKKISLDINTEFLKIIDELAKLTKSSRTLIIESLLGKGISPFFDYLDHTWKRFLGEGRHKEKKKGLEDALRNLKRIKEKYFWLNPRSSWKKLLDEKGLDEKKKKEIIKFLYECNFPS